MSLHYTLYVHVFVVMGVSDCENFRFGYRVIITLLGCVEFIILAQILNHLWEVLNRFDSKAAAWVSGAAETVDYFG